MSNPGVYVIEEVPAQRRPAYKIGMSQDVFARKIALEAGNSAKLRIAHLHETDDSAFEERALHKAFASKLIPRKTEWFWLTASDLGKIANPDWRKKNIGPLVRTYKANQAKKQAKKKCSALKAQPQPISNRPIGSMTANHHGPMSQWDAILLVFEYYGRPLHHKTELTAEIERLGLIKTKGKTPHASIRTLMGKHIVAVEEGRCKQRIKYIKDGVYSLV